MVSFIERFISNSYSMPLYIRLICHLLYSHSLRTFPQHSPPALNKVLFRFLMQKWILP